MYKGIVKVYRTPDPVERVGRDEAAIRRTGEAHRRVTENMKKQDGLVLEVTVTAKTTESLVKKINAMMATLEDE